ncbi:hypothetical protein NMR92_003270 [Vibrio cholerae]|uniref:Uncharacterized protein n=1 Tax=Vibrio parahaemolyticus TaxID=670 RepID=A0A1B1LS17_VIBPH|nr:MULTISPECIES: hypothetical protein [Vibrio]EJL6492308.1 hypothetical protein [Vibrio cholerae]ANS55851.1 hypothetical protein [Vibrio parahaemolyticus]EJL6644152.1 hypothetical protein [Vibrio cholerae]MCA2422552.1 hypothetical protein [Vibrio alginolyticus]MCA2447194.1 hypothetical protein [Vibrio alginolyticus]
MTKFITVVYAINDPKAFKEQQDQIAKLHNAYDPNNPPAWGISAVSHSDEIRRLEIIEEISDQTSDESDSFQIVFDIRDALAADQLPAKGSWFDRDSIGNK